MRIVGGKFRGRNIKVSSGFDSRPTTDFAKEALFNILTNTIDFEEISVLDLFSGTGSITLEFASRGCTDIDLVDSNIRSVQFIAKIAQEMGISGVHTVRMDCFRFIALCKKKYAVIFADPPYELNRLAELPDLIFKHNLLAAGGWFILEHSKSYNFKNHPNFNEERHYGSVHFSFFRDLQ